MGELPGTGVESQLHTVVGCRDYSGHLTSLRSGCDPHRLFPIRERGMNWHSQELQLHEVKVRCYGTAMPTMLTPLPVQAILSDEEARRRLMTSYELMLDFYGMKIQKDSKIGA